jgi:hypothetical protein
MWDRLSLVRDPQLLKSEVPKDEAMSHDRHLLSLLLISSRYPTQGQPHTLSQAISVMMAAFSQPHDRPFQLANFTSISPSPSSLISYILSFLS